MLRKRQTSFNRHHLAPHCGCSAMMSRQRNKGLGDALISPDPAKAGMEGEGNHTDTDLVQKEPEEQEAAPKTTGKDADV